MSRSARSSTCTGAQRSDLARGAAAWLIDLFAAAGAKSALDESFDIGSIATDKTTRGLFVTAERDPKAEAILAGLQARGAKSVFVQYVKSLDGHPSADAMLAAIAATLAWGPL